MWVNLQRQNVLILTQNSAKKYLTLMSSFRKETLYIWFLPHCASGLDPYLFPVSNSCMRRRRSTLRLISCCGCERCHCECPSTTPIGLSIYSTCRHR